MPSSDVHKRENSSKASKSAAVSSRSSSSSITPITSQVSLDDDDEPPCPLESLAAKEAEALEERRRKRRITFTSDADENVKAKKPRRSEPTPKQEPPFSKSTPTRATPERRHSTTTRRPKIQLSEVDSAKSSARKHPIHEIPRKWWLSFSKYDLTTEVAPLKLKSNRRLSHAVLSESNESEYVSCFWISQSWDRINDGFF